MPDASRLSDLTLVDTHSHFDFVEDPHALAEEAAALGICALATTVTPPEYERAARLLEGCENVRVGLGLHPWWLSDGRCTEADVARFEELATGCRFIGEIGLDHSSRLEGTYDRQYDALCREISAALAGTAGNEAPSPATATPRKAFSIHAVRCAGVVLDLLEELEAPRRANCVFHWFSGTTDDLWRAIRLGCWFSVGSHTLRSGRGREYAKLIPSNRLVLETDAPGLEGDEWGAREWRETLERGIVLLAKVRRETELELARITTDNACELLGM